MGALIVVNFHKAERFIDDSLFDESMKIQKHSYWLACIKRDGVSGWKTAIPVLRRAFIRFSIYCGVLSVRQDDD